MPKLTQEERASIRQHCADPGVMADNVLTLRLLDDLEEAEGLLEMLKAKCRDRTGEILADLDHLRLREEALVDIVRGMWSDIRFLRNVLANETDQQVGHYSKAILAIDSLPADLKERVERHA